MASKNFTGTLDLSLGSKAAGMRWRFTHEKTTGDVVRGNFETAVLSDTGEYNFDLKFGQIMIESKLVNQSNWISHGSVVIDENTTISTIPELLVATNPVTEDVILQMQAILQDARDAEASALESSIDAQDLLTETQALVVNKVDKIDGKGLSTNDYDNAAKSKVDEMGTAASRDVTTSNADATEGRLLKVGDFGVGLGFNRADADLDSEFYGFFGNNGQSQPPINPPDGLTGNSRWAGMQIGSVNARMEILAKQTGSGSNSLWFRSTGSQTLPWVSIYHTGNLGESDTAWTSVNQLDNGWSGTVSYIKRGGVVTVVVDVDGAGATSDSVTTLPAGWIPATAITGAAALGDEASRRFSLGVSGQLSLMGGRDGNIRCTITFPIIP